jgi:ribosome recycling factor
MYFEIIQVAEKKIREGHYQIEQKIAEIEGTKGRLEERRKDLAKQVKKIAEEARVAVRMGRRDANDEVKKLQKDKAISEDEGKKAEAEIQKVTDDFIKKVDQVTEEKEKSILTI